MAWLAAMMEQMLSSLAVAIGIRISGFLKDCIMTWDGYTVGYVRPIVHRWIEG